MNLTDKPLSELTRQQVEDLLLAHTLSLEDACLVAGVPYDRSDPRKTLARLTAAIELNAIQAATSPRTKAQ